MSGVNDDMVRDDLTTNDPTTSDTTSDTMIGALTPEVRRHIEGFKALGIAEPASVEVSAPSTNIHKLTNTSPGALAEQLINAQNEHDSVAWSLAKEQANGHVLQSQCKRREHQIRTNPHQSIPAGQRLADVLQADEVYSKLSLALETSQQKQTLLKALTSQLEARVRMISRVLEAKRQEIVLAQMNGEFARAQDRR